MANPTTASGFETFLNGLDTPEKYQAAVASGEFSTAIKSYVSAQNAERESLLADVRAQTEAVITEFAKENGVSKSQAELVFSPKASNKYHKLGNPNAVGAPLNGLFPDVTSYLQAVWHNGNPKADVQDKIQQIRNYQEKVPSEGGFLVPEEFRSELLRLALENSIVRPRARVIPMSSATLRFPKIDSTSNVSSVYGGVVVYRTEEGAELTESEASFGSIKLEATKQTALAHVTNELVRDWGAFGVFIDEIFPEAMAYYEDVDFISGNGVGAPLGALNSGNTSMVVVAKESGQTADTIVWENVLSMYARLLPSSLERSVWLTSPDTFRELATMALSVGTGGSAVWLPNGVGAPTLTLLGRPVIRTEKAPGALGDQGDLSLVDFGMYLIGDRQMMTVDSSPHVKFTSDKTTYRVIQRNDGRPWLDSAITPKNNSATLSAFVTLAARA